MSLYVYETAVEFQSSDQFLGQIRATVQKLKRTHPELRQCSLADLTVKKGREAVNVTLYFQPKN